jgi:Ca2+-transporting ATPase
MCGSGTTNLPDPTSLKETLSSINQPQSKESNLSNLTSKNNGLGSIPSLLKLLQTNADHGINSTEVQSRRELFGSNSLPSSPRKSWVELFIDTFDDETLKILIAAAIVSLVVGIYEDPSTGYIEGVAILTAVLIVSVVTACNDYQKETQFRELSKANDDVQVVVVRDGKIMQVNVAEIVIGDIVHIEAGDAVPCDGVLVKVDSLGIDESALTGEPIDIEKDLVQDPFVLSGCIATAGTASFVAIAVGKESQWGIIKAHLEKEQDQTPLQEKLDTMANQIGNVGIASAIATFVAMMFMKLYVKPAYLDNVSVFNHALDAFIIGVTIVVVAVPEGLPLSVTIALSYSTKKMLADKNLIRVLVACETMGNATNICSDKTGTLTENRMTVVKGVFANVHHEDTAPEHKEESMSPDVSSTAKEIILQAIATCSTAKIIVKEDEFHPTVVGNKTEASLLLLAKSSFFGNDNIDQRRADANFGKPGGSRLFPFSSSRKRMSVLVKNKSTSDWTLYHKGAGEIVLENCSSYLDADGSVKPMTNDKREELKRTISKFASQALRCMALSHRSNVGKIINPVTATVEECANICEKDMILDALVGIVDPLRQDVVEAVKTCQNAGIIVRMVTGDNLETANAIAKEAGILTQGEFFIDQ